jgi:hypothetical protein
VNSADESVQCPTVQCPTVPGQASRRPVDAAVADATYLSVPVTVAIVDESGDAAAVACFAARAGLALITGGPPVLAGACQP